ncbi:MAG: radical SAM protein [Fibrobacteria bacterium]
MRFRTVPRLIDKHGRVMRKLRVSLTDACNYQCFYCMPARPVFTRKGLLLEPSEYRALCGSLVAAGIEELRITGGEPTVRPGFESILENLGGLPVRRKGITSNGHLLAGHLRFLKANGWNSINISLDSLDPGRFASITGGGDFRTVMACIEKAAGLGLRVKVNSVVMRGVNDDELEDFTEWGARSGIEVRFLEYMRIGPDLARHPQRFMSAEEMISALRRKYHLEPLRAAPDSTALLFGTDSGAKLGFIASESKAFCATCSRLRLSATGVLRACVMNPEGISIRHASPDDLPGIFAKVMGMKPLIHPDSNPLPMHALGG